MKKSFSTIILAAGKGVRMQSSLPKVLHPVAGQAMLLRIIEQAKLAGTKETRVVVGFGQNLVQELVGPTGAQCFPQKEQKGTADAVSAALPAQMDGPVLILNGDHPLIESEDIKRVLDEHSNGKGGVTVVSAKLEEPAQYGRIVRDSSGMVRAIVEAKDASAETLKGNEVNTGIYMMDAEILKKYLPRIQNKNAQKEYYLTDIIMLAAEDGVAIAAVQLGAHVSMGVNSQMELARATREIFARKAKRLMDAGVVIISPENTFIEDAVEIGQSSVIYPGVFIKGATRIGSFCVLEPNVFINQSTCEDSVQIRAGSYLENCSVKKGSIVGPYARLRPETNVGENCRIGNFVELKNVKFGNGAKANHLAYLGDAEIGDETNIGCGTITCNYAADKKKYKTKIGKNVFVGSDSQFVAPVEVGDDAIIGSGSTITKNVPAKALAVARGRQTNIENYKIKSKTAATNKDNN